MMVPIGGRQGVDLRPPLTEAESLCSDGLEPKNVVGEPTGTSISAEAERRVDREKP